MDVPNLTKGTHIEQHRPHPERTNEKAIYFIRGEKVMLDRDLAELYQVQTKALNQAVRRNADRFPADLMFQLSEKEVAELNRSQFVTGSRSIATLVFGPMLLPNRALRCYRVCYEASAR